jgi:hypothetical protein
MIISITKEEEDYVHVAFLFDIFGIVTRFGSTDLDFHKEKQTR